ncbi:MAG: hypothetical protein LC637_06720 [Xanthomonadaceae bacterium]|nr:hypothetical protein [Xanthomonadaceae bacterium]
MPTKPPVAIVAPFGMLATASAAEHCLDELMIALRGDTIVGRADRGG